MESQTIKAETTFILTKNKHVSLCAFSDRVSEKTGGICHISSTFDQKKSPRLLLIDVASLGIDYSFEILRLSDALHHTPNCILYNVPNQIFAIKLIEWPHVAGAFTPDDDAALILDLLPLLLDEHIWISTTLANKLLKHIRRKPRQTHIDLKEVKLTKRERQILCLLKDGYSNQKIGELIYVSEHTIKSHLYSTYRKIGVSTRLEASNWVMDNRDLLEDGQ